MYKFKYDEVLEDHGQSARKDESTAIEQSIELLRVAEANGVRSREAVEALFYLRRLWTRLIEDLGSPDIKRPREEDKPANRFVRR